MNAKEWEVFYRRIRKMVHSIDKHIKTQLSHTSLNDITIAEISIIDSIGEQADKTIKEIAGDLGVAVSTPTKTMDRLVQKGYILRQPSEDDRRMVVSSLTEKGEEAYTAIMKIRRTNIEKFMHLLSEEELNSFAGITQKISMGMESF